MTTQTFQKWKKVRLSDLGSVERGRSRHRPRNDASLYGGIYPFIQTGDIKSANFYIDSYSQTYNEKGLAQSKLWNPNTLGITIAANIGESAILKMSACFPDSVVGFQSYENISDVRYVKYLLDLIKNQFQAISQGTTQDNLSLEKLLSIDLDVPEYLTQKQIADVLYVYDNLIANNNHRIKILEQIVQKIYTEWFVNFHFPGHERTKSQKNGLPEGWEVKEISNIVELLNGFSFKSKTYLQGGKYKIVTIKNVHDAEFVDNFDSFLDLLPLNMPGHCLLEEGDILLSLTGNVGRVCLVFGEKNLLNQRVAKIKSNFMAFAYCLFRNNDFFNRVTLLANGAAQQNLSPIEIVKIKIAVPPTDLLESFEGMTYPIIKEIVNLHNQKYNFKKSRDLLIPQLITGKLEINI